MENVRFALEYEQGGKGSPQREEFGRRLAELADIFIFEAAGDLASEGASVEDLPRHFVDKGGEIFVGPATGKENEMFDPVVRDGIDAIVFGGVKKDKVKPLIDIVKNLSVKLQFVFLGSSSSKAIAEGDELLKNLFETYPDKILRALDYDSPTTTNDIGDRTIALYLQKLDTLRAGQTVLVNGTMGWVEKEYRKGTEKVNNKLKELAQRGVRIVVIGGDASSNARRYGLDQQPNVFMFTGGGVQLKILAGKQLTGVVALQEAHNPFISARKKKAALLRLIVRKKRFEMNRDGGQPYQAVLTGLNAFRGSFLDQINEAERRLSIAESAERKEKIRGLVDDLIEGHKLLAGEDVDVLFGQKEVVARIDRKIVEELGYPFTSTSSPITVLVVDTNENSFVSFNSPANVLRRQANGYRIFEANSPEKALEILRTESVGLMVSDLGIKQIALNGQSLPPVVMSSSDLRALNGELPKGVKVVSYERGYIEEALPRAATQAFNGDGASLSPAAQGVQRPGGIDLNPALLDLQIKRDANFVPLPLPQQPLQQMHIEGFIPVIINITPVTNLPLLLGLADTEQDTDETQPAMKAREVEEISVLN